MHRFFHIAEAHDFAGVICVELTLHIFDFFVPAVGEVMDAVYDMATKK